MSMGEQSTWKERWDEMRPAYRLSIVGGVVIFILVLALVLWPSSGKRKPPPGDSVPKAADLFLPKVQDRTVEQLAGTITAQESATAKLRTEVKRLADSQRSTLKHVEDALKGLEKAGRGGVTQELLDEIRGVKGRLEELEARRALDTRTPPNPTADTKQPARREGSPPKKPLPPAIKVVGEASVESVETGSPRKVPPYLPANSMFEGVLLNGMDAPTDQTARKNPVPAVIRVKSEAILPNLISEADIRECFVGVAGYGDMADERAKMRLETLSCVLESEDPDAPPTIVEAKVEGYINGDDGRVGQRGRLRSKQGQLIAKTMLAGVLSGLGDALKPRAIQGLDINPTGRVQTQTVDPATVGTAGLAQGVSDTAKSISDYYLKLADQMMPVLEIDAMQKVTVVLLKGVELK